MEAIVVDQLTKTFEDVTAVDHISFSVPQGELFGLLGPNGAGKTTTINMLSTLLKPTSGRAEVGGHDVVRNRDAVRRSIGVVFQEPALDGKLTGRENLEFHAMMYGLRKDERNRRINEVLELVELTDKAKVLVDKYSGGMKRRLEIGLSGALYPLDNLPLAVRVLSYADPLTYGIDGLRGTMIGVNARPIALDFAILCGFALVMLVLGTYFFEKSESV